MSYSEDPKQTIWDKVGDLHDVEVMYSQVLLGIFIRPTKTKGGILLTDETRAEDRYQGKVCMVLKKGPFAFVDTDEVKFQGLNVEVGDWVVIRASDGWALSVNGHDCRMVNDTGIRMKIERPDSVY